MNREMRRLQEREERLQKKQEPDKGKAAKRAPGAPQGERKSFFLRIRDYLHEVRVEMRKVTWPTREQMIAFSAVTVVTCVLLTAVVFGLDVLMKELVFWLVARTG